MTKKNDKKKGFKPYSKKLSSDQDDSDSVDSRGNIRNLIDYGSTDEMFSEDSNNSNYSATDKIETDYNSKKHQGTTNKLINKLQKEKERLIQQLKYKDDDKKKVYKTRSTKKNNSEDVIMDKNDSDDEDYDDEEYDDEDYDDEEDDEDYDEEEDKEDGNHPKAFTFSFGGMDESEKSVPKRHDMKKETADVKEFVKLITTPSDEDTIDGQIDQFKALSEDKKTKLLNVLGNRNKASGTSNPQQGLMFKILTMDLPPETQSMVMSKYNSLQNLDPGSSEYFKLRNWLEKLTSIPIGIYKELPVTINNGVELCRTFMENARKCLDNAIYGQDEAKLQILQFIGTKIANPTGRGLSLLLSGPPGIGKTSLIKYGVAKALEWPFQFISLGGDSDASTYTGHQLVYESSHCGKIVNSLCSAKSMSMVLMFDELDKISTTPKGEEVQNLLVHLTDPVQNGEFEDKYLSGVNIDLSRIMFTFSANDLNKIDRVLLDRMIVVQLQGYNQKEKVAIAENYLLPAALKDVGLTEKVAVSKEVLEYVLSEYASEETGVRELKRCMEQITQKVNMLRMFNSKELPFYIKDFTLPFVVKKEHVDLFLKKRSASIDISAKMMYI
jgi:ATP-dependent Lon protease